MSFYDGKRVNFVTAGAEGTFCHTRTSLQPSNNFPTGFANASIEMETEPSGNVRHGVLPDIDVNTNSVRFYYCCREDGMRSQPMKFGNIKPIVLLKHSSYSCQGIQGEFVIFTL